MVSVEELENILNTGIKFFIMSLLSGPDLGSAAGCRDCRAELHEHIKFETSYQSK